MKRLSLYWNTLRHLKVRQVRYQLWYRLRAVWRRATGFRYPTLVSSTPGRLDLMPWIEKYEGLSGPETFSFLNLTGDFAGWNDMRFGHLWAYNLNYMDFLLQKGASFPEGRRWIGRFIMDAGTNKCGMEPYPIALRGINWIKFITEHYEEIPKAELQAWSDSLYAQYLVLVDNLEYHLLGNHLLEDAFSLLWGALYFDDGKLYTLAEKLLRTELQEQVLADGAHFEQSPMYHAILLDRLLDCINISQNNVRFPAQEDLTAFMQGRAVAMLGWLEAIVYDDGTFPLFNDSANGVAPPVAQIFAYAGRLGLSWQKGVLRECGYRKFSGGTMELVVDVADIKSGYIPGHTHADTFTFELRVGGRPFIIDSGVSTYNKNGRRAYERGTAAHNTVSVNGADSSRVWGGFRVAQRASVEHLEESVNSITAMHDGYRKSGVSHERSFRLAAGSLLVEDSLIPAGKPKGLGSLILAPHAGQVDVRGLEVVTDRAVVKFKGVDEIWLESDCEVAEEFNRLRKTIKICYSFSGNAGFEIIPL